MNNEDRRLYVSRARESRHSFFERRYRNESKLIEHAFVLSSAIEILTTKSVKQRRLKPRETKTLIDTADFLEKVRSVDKYLASEKTRYMLQSEDIDLLSGVTAYTEKSLEKPIENSLTVIRKMIDTKEIITDDPKSLDELTELLRLLFNGLKVTMVQGDDLRENFDTF